MHSYPQRWLNGAIILNSQRSSPDATIEPLWNLLQVSDVLDLELASALAGDTGPDSRPDATKVAYVAPLGPKPVLAWEPQRMLWPSRIACGAEEEPPSATGSTLRVRALPLLRGFARPPMSWFSGTGLSVLQRLLSQTADSRNSPLICTVPFFASVAELWPGPVIYWLTDLIAAYPSANRRRVEQLDRRLCSVSTLVCPNSSRLAEYLVQRAGCDPAKIHILPNATRGANVLPAPPNGPMAPPDSIASIPRPFAGIIGNLAGNMDWLLLERTIALTPWLHWVFVGPTVMEIADASQRAARQTVMNNPRTHFVGRQPYGELAAFARSFDVAVLPYKRCEPTYSGSSTRFYEHLAACRPMVATPGLEELNRKTPLLTLVNTAEEAAVALEKLRACDFNDGLLGERWEQSRHGTWETRASSLRDALARRLSSPNGA